MQTPVLNWESICPGEFARMELMRERKFILNESYCQVYHAQVVLRVPISPFSLPALGIIKLTEIP